MSVSPLNRQRRPAVAAVFALVIAAAVVEGAVHHTCPPAEGGSLASSPAEGVSTPRLRIASFNIHGCRNEQGESNLDRTAEALQDFDLIGLNEVHGAWSWQRADQAELLGRQLGLPWLFAPTTRRWWRDDFGNGLLCRLPVSRWKRVPLPGTRSKGHRNMIVAEIAFGARTLHLLVTHLDNVQDGPQQLELIANAFLAMPEPAILMGDLNTKASDPQLARLLATPGVYDLVSAPHAHVFPERIDWILGRGVRAGNGGIIATGASDHPLVWTEIELDCSSRLQSSCDSARQAAAQN